MPKDRETVTLVCPPVKEAECIACGGPSEVLTPRPLLPPQR